ncbi:MAG: hypothetical protein QG608_1161 [Actinomycetota bacterium]|nr:hypothetical protein [Actinomycetota bacterium]
MVRFVLHGVKARVFGTLGDASACTRQIGLAEHAFSGVRSGNTPDWMASFLCEAHVASVTGQAAYALARATNEFSCDAHDRLAGAIAAFDESRARAVALCSTRLAALHLRAGNLDDGIHAARTALDAAPGLRSARITRDLVAVRSAADQRPHDSTRELSTQITDALALTV